MFARLGTLMCRAPSEYTTQCMPGKPIACGTLQDTTWDVQPQAELSPHAPSVTSLVI
jgi:hypothetical protein